MAGDEKFCLMADQFLLDAGCIAVGMTADMRHVHGYRFTVPNQLLRIHTADIVTVNIAVNAPERQSRMAGQAFGKPHRSKIAGMPDLITSFKMPENGFVQVAVRIRYQSYPCQLFFLGKDGDLLVDGLDG